MNIATVSSSIIATTYISKLLRQKFNWHNPVDCQLLKAGVNHTYVIKVGEERYVFRIYSYAWRTVLEIKEELHLLNILKAENISISYPIAFGREEYLVKIPAPEGERFGVLFSYADGAKLMSSEPKVHFAIGVLMGQIHQITSTLTLKRVNYTPSVLLDDSIARIAEFLPEGTEELAFLKEKKAQLHKAYAEMEQVDLRKGVVHLDIWFDNLNIGENGQITLFDFDFCGNGYLAMDVAYYLMQLFYLEKDTTAYAEKAKQFISGYTSKAELTDSERAFLPAMGLSLYFFYLGVQCQRHEDWSNVFLNETYLKRYIVAILKPYMDKFGL